MRCRIIQALFLVAMSGLILSGPVRGQSTEDSAVDFDRQIKPILSDRCFVCHGPDEAQRQADLRLDLAADAMNVIEPGDPENSALMERILSTEADEVMPPPDSNLALSDQEKELFRRWIEQGATWQWHWSFVAPLRPQVPPDDRWATNEIDRFVVARMGQNKPSPIASKERLIRRLTFDLTGLPPTIQEIDRFLADDSENAYERLVDQLLERPEFGERLASEWLDSARYSDTFGYQVDRDRRVWPWRDWVVRSLNSNMSYDQFLTEQIAGDLLPDASADQVLATAFNRLHPQKVEGGSVPEEFRVEYVADRLQTVSTAFMGLTMECARCHDHKYDPISQREYYQLFSFFNNIDEAGLYSYFTPSVPTPTLGLPTHKQSENLERLNDKVTELESRYQKLRTGRMPQFEQWLSEFDSKIESQPELDPVSDSILAVDDWKEMRKGNNRLIDGPDGMPAIELSGDDEVNLKVGNFDRAQPFSIVARIWIPDQKERSVVFHRSRAWTDAGSRGYELLIVDGYLRASLIHFWPGNAISVSTVEPLATKRWHHVVMTYDGSSRAAGLRLSINGKSVPLRTVRDSLQKQITGGGGDHLTIGARFRDKGFTGGRVCDFKVFERRLSNLEVQHLFDGKSIATSELRTQQQRMAWYDYYLEKHDVEARGLSEDLRKARQQRNRAADEVSEIMVMREMGQPRQAYVLNRGAYDQIGDPVQPTTPTVFPPLKVVNETKPANRRDLAQWLVSREHPLTARVAVNRYWQLIFGEGLVRTPEDFGRQGSPPTHPQLLDWLAVEFMESGWNIKRLIKLMVLSSTYRQSSAVTAEMLEQDPENLQLGRAHSYRLPAEMLRDNALAVSGLLVNSKGGPPVRPYEVAVSFKPVKPDTGPGRYRRSLYTYWKRTGPAPVMMTLDASKRDVCQVKRERTSSPLQSLVLLNGPLFVEAAKNLARQLLEVESDERTIATQLFRQLTSRRPDNDELRIIIELYRSQFEYFTENPDSADLLLKDGNNAKVTFPAEGNLQANSESSSDATEIRTVVDPMAWAAWTTVANTLMNFDECVTKR